MINKSAHSISSSLQCDHTASHQINYLPIYLLVNNNNQICNPNHSKLINELLLMQWKENRGMSNPQELMSLRSFYLLSLIIIEKKNYQTKTSNLNTRLEFKVDELKICQIKT